MILSSILHREFLQDIKKANILWTPTDNSRFKNFIKKVLPNAMFLEFDHTYFGNVSIDIIICNNRASHLEKSIESAKYFHCPVLVVDQEIKPTSIIVETNKNMPIEPIAQIALSRDIAISWGLSKDHRVLSFNDNDKENIQEWQKIIDSLIKSVVRIKQ